MSVSARTIKDNCKPRPKWRRFQRAVAEIIARIYPEGDVDECVWVEGPDCRRDVDVRIRGVSFSASRLALIECKDYDRPLDIGVVDALHSKAQDLKSDITFLIGRSGFSRAAIRKANRVGIICVQAGRIAPTGQALSEAAVRGLLVWTTHTHKRGSINITLRGQGVEMPETPGIENFTLGDVNLWEAVATELFVISSDVRNSEMADEYSVDLDVTFALPLKLSDGTIARFVDRVRCRSHFTIEYRISEHSWSVSDGLIRVDSMGLFCCPGSKVSISDFDPDGGALVKRGDEEAKFIINRQMRELEEGETRITPCIVKGLPAPAVHLPPTALIKRDILFV